MSESRKDDEPCGEVLFLKAITGEPLVCGDWMDGGQLRCRDCMLKPGPNVYEAPPIGGKERE